MPVCPIPRNRSAAIASVTAKKWRRQRGGPWPTHRIGNDRASSEMPRVQQQRRARQAFNAHVISRRKIVNAVSAAERVHRRRLAIRVHAVALSHISASGSSKRSGQSVRNSGSESDESSTS